MEKMFKLPLGPAIVEFGTGDDKVIFDIYKKAASCSLIRKLRMSPLTSTENTDGQDYREPDCKGNSTLRPIRPRQTS
ncbi:hypothetical protein P7H19_21580 [Paenibacillus larvae]|nr:hypothetical protein [Paenibacillus larvae]MDT2238345.1 hypothetical protein [Paenibacillus larvae]